VGRTTPRLLYPRERPGTHCAEGWMGPRAGLDVCEKSRPPPPGIFLLHLFNNTDKRITCNRSPDRPARSQSLYRLSYQAHMDVYIYIYVCVCVCVCVCKVSSLYISHLPCEVTVAILNPHAFRIRGSIPCHQSVTLFRNRGEDPLGLSLSCLRIGLMNCSFFILSTLER
jgi:hypothetical protein